MEKSAKIIQLYGYVVCLTTIIVTLVSVSSFIGSLFDLGDPIHSDYMRFQQKESLASFENYKMDILKMTKEKEVSSSTSYVPDDNTLKTMYESAKSDRIQLVNHHAHRSITIDSFLILLSIILFITHWRWMRKINRTET